jgi:uncharacterized protein
MNQLWSSLVAMKKFSHTTQQDRPRPGEAGSATPSPQADDDAHDAQLLDALSKVLLACSPFALAFSGGVDSRFLAHMGDRLAPQGVRMRLFHIRGLHVPWSDSAGALGWAGAHGFGVTLVPVNPLSLPQVKANDKQRCYHCKLAAFATLQEAVALHPDFAGQTAPLCDGTHLSDHTGYRPGLRALEELKVRSPLLEAGLNKADVRRLAAKTGLDYPDQCSRPCLLTRLAYGLAPGKEMLLAIEAAEKAVDELLTAQAEAVPDFRLRIVAGPERAEAGNASPAVAPLSACRTELHLSAEVPEALCGKLIKAVTSQGLPAPLVRALDQVSSYFDREQAGA